MSDLSAERPRHLFTTIGAAAVIVLFLASLFLIFLTNRFSPTVAAGRPPSMAASGGSIAYLGDFALSYRTTGADHGKPPVILLLGGPGESGIGFHDGFRFLETSRQVVSYDPRGSGLSQVRPSLSHYTVSALVTELEAVREQIVKAESVAVVGCGFGAAIAVRYACEYPGRVDRLVLLSPMPPDGVRYDSILDLLGESAEAIEAAGIPPSDPASADGWQDRFTLATDLTLEAHSVLARRPWIPHASFGTARALLTSLVSSPQWTDRDVAPLPTATLLLIGPEDDVPGILPHLLPGMKTVRTTAHPHPLEFWRDPMMADTLLRFLDGPL